MTYTSHGHHIKGTILDDTRPSRVARCGGPGVCQQCSAEAGLAPRPIDEGKPPRFGNVNEGVPEDYQEKARWLVQRQYNVHGIGTPRGEKIEPLEDYEIYVVWFAYTLGNWKALISTMRPDDRYYEVTYDKAKNRTYIDTYLKTHNIVVED